MFKNNWKSLYENLLEDHEEITKVLLRANEDVERIAVVNANLTTGYNQLVSENKALKADRNRYPRNLSKRLKVLEREVESLKNKNRKKEKSKK